MPKIVSKSTQIDTNKNTPEVLAKVKSFSGSPKKWTKGGFINVIKKKNDRLKPSSPLSAVYIVKGENPDDGDTAPTVFFSLDENENIVGGVFTENIDSVNFSKDYPEKSFAASLSLFKVEESSYGPEGVKKIEENLAEKFKTISEDSKILLEANVSPSVNQEELGINFNPVDFSPEVISSIYGSLLDSGINVKEVLNGLEKKYQDKIREVLKLVNATGVEHKQNQAAKAAPQVVVAQNVDPMIKKKAKLASSAEALEKNTAKRKLPRMDSQTFKKMVRENTINTNRACRKFWKGVIPEKGNPMQEEISKYFTRNMWIMLTGDTGIGKTYNPLDMAEKNDIPFVEIKLHQDIEHSDLAGTKELSVDIDSGEMDTSFMTGPFIRGLKNAAEAAKKGRGFLMILDEILRVKDNSLFISGFSKSGAGEYGFEYGDGVDFRLIDTPTEGPVWFKLSEFDEKDSTPYEIDSEGQIFFHKKKETGEFLFKGDENEVAERCWRDKIPTISKEKYRILIKENNVPVRGRFAANSKVYVPSNSLYVIGTTNVGNGYTVGMKADAAFSRRFFPVEAKRAPVPFMVKKKLEEQLELRGPDVSKTWNNSVSENIEKILTTFFTAMDEKIRSTAKDAPDGDFGQKVNFAMIEDALAGLDDDDPISDKEFGLMATLDIAARKFAPVDFGVTTEKMQKHPLVRAARETIKEIERGGSMHKSKKTNASKKADVTDAPIRSNMGNGGNSTSTAQIPKKR